MRIDEFVSGPEESVEARLLAAASEDNLLGAFRATRLLELVRFLRSRGPVPAVHGCLILDELWLFPCDPVGDLHVKLWVDWRDHGPAEGGLPRSAYYRLQFKRRGEDLTHDARAETPAEVDAELLRGFGRKG